MKIMIVDDAPSITNLLANIIEEAGHKHIAFNAGIEALKNFEKIKPDLILLDVEMPDKTGFEVAKNIRSQELKNNSSLPEIDLWTPIIFLTVHQHDENIEQGILAGGDDYIFKPISTKKVMAKIIAMQRIVKMRKKLTYQINVTKHITNSLIKEIDHRKISEKELKKALKTKQQFYSNIYNEVKTPLSGILSLIEVIQNPQVNLEQKEQYINNIAKSCEYLNSIINNFLQIPTIDNENNATVKESFSPTELLENIEKSCKKIAQQQQISFYTNILYPFPERVIGDYKKIKQILINLCSNAMQQVTEGYIQIILSYNIEQYTLNANVNHTGCCILYDVASDYENLLSTNNSENNALDSVKHLVRSIDGKIKITEEPNCGSNIKIIIPLALEENSAYQKAKKKNISTKSTCPKFNGHILIAEAWPDAVQSLEWQLEPTGAIINTAGNGKQAIEIALSENPDLILMDTAMPKLNGKTAVRVLRYSGFLKPIIALDSQQQHNIEYYLALGFSNVLKMPITTENLFNILKEYAPCNPINNIQHKDLYKKYSSLEHNLVLLEKALVSNKRTSALLLIHATKGLVNSLANRKLIEQCWDLRKYIHQNHFNLAKEQIQKIFLEIQLLLKSNFS